MSTRAKRLTPEGLIPLHHLWYDAARVVTDLCDQLGQDDAAGVYMLLLNAVQGGEAAARRWTEWVSGRQKYVSLPVVDRVYVAAGLNMWTLGDPDVHCSSAPGARAEATPYTPTEKLGQLALTAA